MFQYKDIGWLIGEKKKTCLQETHFRTKDTHGLKVRGWKKIFHANKKDKKGEVAILISNKINFNTKSITNDKGHYIMIKESVQEEDVTLVNIYASNTGAPKYIEQILTDIKGEFDNTKIGGDFNTPLKSVYRSSRQKINKETVVLNNTISQLDIIYIYMRHSIQNQ